MLYVTDTHSYLWYMSDDKRLGENARKIFSSAEDGQSVIIVPAIVLAEIFHILQKRGEEERFALIAKKLSIGENFTTLPLDIRIASTLPKFPKVKELHDKIIVASAALLEARVITKDRNIADSGYVNTIW